MLSLPQGRRQYLNEQMRHAGRVSVVAQVQCVPRRGGDEIGFTNYGQDVAAMKSDKPSLRLAASATPDNIGGLDDNARFAHVVMPSVVTVDDLEAVERTQANPGDRDLETPETTLLAQIDAEQLRAAIATLPAPFRETLVLRDIEGLDYREIAQTTEVPIGTVMSRLARARHRLTVTLGGKSHD